MKFVVPGKSYQSKGRERLTISFTLNESIEPAP